jgi:menaquinone-dependent protoporphyrinogen oxidase
MARILIIYGSEEGQTAKITDHITGFYRSRNHEVDTVFGKTAPDDLKISDYDGVIIGASIHMGHHAKYMIELAKRHNKELNHELSAFFTVCLTAASCEPKDQATVEQYVEDWITDTDWRPDQIGVFAGAVLYSQYGLVKRFIMKRISKQRTGDTDTSHDYEYTDWESVDDFAESFLIAVVGESVLV